MGERGPTPRFAALAIGGWVLRPPISQAEAEVAFGRPLPPCVWARIVRGFARLGHIRDQLDAPRLNKNKDDPRSYSIGREIAERDIKRAFSIISNQIDQAELNFAIQDNADRVRESYDPKPMHQRLKAVADELMHMMATIRDAEPEAITVPSDAQARNALARYIFAALDAAGLSDRGSGWSDFDGMSEADLTPAHRLISALGVIQHETPCSTAAAIRKALAQNPGEADRWFSS